MRISELADATHETTRTIRFYEASGLLPAPTRTPGGYRDYDPVPSSRSTSSAPSNPPGSPSPTSPPSPTSATATNQPAPATPHS